LQNVSKNIIENPK